MNKETLKRIIDSIDEDLSTSNEEVKALLGNLELSDSAKKSQLIQYLANVQVHLMFVRNDLAAELDTRTKKKFYQFWK